MKTVVKFLLLFTAILGFSSRMMASDFIIVAHRDTQVSAVSKDDMKGILLGNKTKWDNGTLIKLAILSGGLAHEKIILEATSKSTDQFDKYWKKQVFTGKGVMPDSFSSDAELIAWVAKTPGAIGYVAVGSVTTGTKELPLN